MNIGFIGRPARCPCPGCSEADIQLSHQPRARLGRKGREPWTHVVFSLGMCLLSIYQRQLSPQGLQVQTQGRYNTPGVVLERLGGKQWCRQQA